MTTNEVLSLHYSSLLLEYPEVTVREKNLLYGFKGLYKNGNIIIKKNMSEIEKGCILAEELGHHFRTAGNIIDQTQTSNIKQEKLARQWAYNEILPLTCFIDAYHNGCTNRYEVADFLEVTEEFLQEALNRYIEKHGNYIFHEDIVIHLNPLNIFRNKSRNKVR
ncbi:ImmA/IrrE family metallo-endopeptidase [Peribacillus simplex]|uniref:ImmA/IrrE family metallo-endopeptidase n=1 Tax=Peribacillus simplex TaxID=1478 RepID=UPI003D2CE38B